MITSVLFAIVRKPAAILQQFADDAKAVEEDIRNGLNIVIVRTPQQLREIRNRNAALQLVEEQRRGPLPGNPEDDGHEGGPINVD